MKHVSAWVSTHLPIVAVLMFVTAGAVVSATGDKHLANGGLIDINGQNVTTLRDSSGNPFTSANPLFVTGSTANPNYTRIQDGAGTGLLVLDAVGQAQITLCARGNATNCASVNAQADTLSNSPNGVQAIAQNYGYNGATWDRARKDTYAAGPQWQTDGGASATAISANSASPQVIKGTAGRLARIMVTSSAAAEIDCFDNATAASGTKIGVIASGAAVGTVGTFEMRAASGITCDGGATYPGYTISYW